MPVNVMKLVQPASNVGIAHRDRLRWTVFVNLPEMGILDKSGSAAIRIRLVLKPVQDVSRFVLLHAISLNCFGVCVVALL